MEITLRPRTLRRALVACIGTVIYAGFWAEVWYALELKDPWSLVAFLSLSYEANLPTWFSSSQLFACGLVLALIALGTRQSRAPYARHWAFLAGIFFYISLDEAVRIHEYMNHWLDLGGALYFSWIVPAAGLVAIIGLSYLRFLTHLPRQTRRRFVTAGILYVGGALFMEIPLGWWTVRAGDDNFVYAMIDLVEESLELAGAGFFLYALLLHLGGPEGAVPVFLEPSPAPSEPRSRGLLPALPSVAALVLCAALYFQGPSELRILAIALLLPATGLLSLYLARRRRVSA